MSKDIEMIHKELLILLENFHKLCVQNGIKYSLHGGTLLGAIREEGFIAWDDDADITMDRENFDKFCLLMKTIKLSKGFAFVDINRFPQFVMKRNGCPIVWADIFVYDYISEKQFVQRLKMAGTKFFILMTRTISDQRMSNLNGLYKGVNKFFINALVYMSQIIPYRFRIRLAKWFMKQLRGNKSFVHRSNDTRIGSSMVLPATINTDYILTNFEDKKLMIVKDYDTVLKSSYGVNYMTPRKDKPDIMHSIMLKREQEAMEKFVFLK